MAGLLQHDKTDVHDPILLDEQGHVLERQPHSSAGWADGAVTGGWGIIRLTLIVAVFFMLTFVGIIWFGLHPLMQSLEPRLHTPYPVIIPRVAPAPVPAIPPASAPATRPAAPALRNP